MATFPVTDYSRDCHSCASHLLDCDGGDQSMKKTKNGFPGRKRQLMDHSEMKETEDLIASEFSKLSVQERSKALDDVHCVGGELEETPEMIERSLVEFDEMVQTTADRIYAIALNQNRSYVEDPSFRLKFLRVNMFNVRKSVHHMMNFLRQKALYFGEAKVACSILPADMNKEEIAVMRSGCLQILKDRDRNGRVILYNSNPPECKVETMVRVLYHIIFNNMVRIPSVQTKGFVLIYNDDSKGNSNRKLPGFSFHVKASSFFEALPWRLSTFHICLYSSPGSLAPHNRMFQASLNAASAASRIRTRLHYGSDMERLYQLRSYGIPLDKFPVDKDGDRIHQAWCDEYLGTVASNVDKRANSKNGATKTDGILETDVMFGRGRTVYHVGNVRYRLFLEGRAEAYDKVPRDQRAKVCSGYTQELMSSGFRFMKQTETRLWVECEFFEVVEKVAQFFRTRRRDKRQKGKPAVGS